MVHHLGTAKGKKVRSAVWEVGAPSEIIRKQGEGGGGKWAWRAGQHEQPVIQSVAGYRTSDGGC